jgi:RNA polymerase I-specific transcription initiation factor RRN3
LTPQPLQLHPHLLCPTPTPAAAPSSTLHPSNKEKLKATLRTQFNTLLSIFDRTILRTFKSRYTQFLIFWYTSVDPEFADVFQGMLVERALMPSASPAVLVRSSLEDDSRGDESSTTANIHLLTPEVTRAAAASYIGSFVSRATFVDREGTRRVIGVLCEFLKAHLEGVEQAVRDGVFGFDPSASSMLASGQHLVFYSVTQAVFLIFCFRWRDLMVDGVEDEEDLGLKGTGGHPRKWTTTGSGKDIWLPELSVLKRTVSSILNPLKVCSSNVVNQFARIAHSTNFLYCYTILDVNKRAEVGDSSPPRCGPNETPLSSVILTTSQS